MGGFHLYYQERVNGNAEYLIKVGSMGRWWLSSGINESQKVSLAYIMVYKGSRSYFNKVGVIMLGVMMTNSGLSVKSLKLAASLLLAD